MKAEEKERLRLVFLKQFALGTPYSGVVGYIQRLNHKFDIANGYVDQSAIGESLLEEIKEFAPQISGLTFTAKVKQDLMILLQTRMEQRRMVLPLDRALLSQINEQQYRFGKAKPTEKPEEKGIMDILSSIWNTRRSTLGISLSPICNQGKGTRTTRNDSSKPMKRYC